MKIRKPLLVLLAAVMLVSACQTATIAASTPQEQIQLKFFGYKLGSEEGTIPQIIADFEKEYPHIDVEYEAIPTTNGYADVINSRLAAKDTLDVFMGQVPATEIYLNAGYLEDLSDQPWVDRLLDSVKHNIVQNDKYYLLTLETSAIGLYSNTKMLQECGIEIPSNWSEFLDACEKIKATGVAPIVMGDKAGWSAGRIYFQEGGNLANENPNLGYDIAEQRIKPSEALIGALKKYETIVQYTNGEEALGMQWNDQALTAFVSGEHAFYFGGAWQQQQMKDADAAFEFQFSPLPIQEEGKPNAYIMIGTSLFVNADSKHKAEAKLFLEFWARPENLNPYVQSQNSFPTVKDGVGAESPNAVLMIEAFREGRTCIFPRGLEFTNNLSQSAFKGLQMILLGSQTPEQVGQDMDDELETSLALK